MKEGNSEVLPVAVSRFLGKSCGKNRNKSGSTAKNNRKEKASPERPHMMTWVTLRKIMCDTNMHLRH